MAARRQRNGDAGGRNPDRQPTADGLGLAGRAGGRPWRRIRCRQSTVALGVTRVDSKVVGPSFKEVAAKYRGKDVEAALLEKVKNGGSGVWGQIPMPANAQVPEQDLQAMVKWILALN